MALLRYFQVTASLPTAENTTLGDTVTQSANAAVLREVQAERPRKRKAYTVFTAEQRATIGKYASEHGNAAAVKFKANIEGGQLGESTVRLFKKRYFEELKKAKHSGATVPEVKSIASRKRGRPLTLGDVDTKAQAYIKALRKAGTPVNVNIVLAAAEGVVTAVDRTLLKKNGGTIELKCPWAQSLMRCMKFVKRRGSTQVKAKLSVADIAKLRKSYLLQIKGMVDAHNIPSQLVINWDQAGIKLVPSGLNDKHQVTATLAGTLSGKILPLQILYQGKTERCHPSQTFPDGFDIWHTPNHWANEETTLRFIENVILPYDQAPDQAALAIFDVFKGHM